MNLLRMHSRDAYAYCLPLMDSLFTKEELAQSLLFKSKKSDKPGLDSARVEKMLGEIAWKIHTMCICLLPNVSVYLVAFTFNNY